jgi:hypothetical protein
MKMKLLMESWREFSSSPCNKQGGNIEEDNINFLIDNFPSFRGNRVSHLLSSKVYIEKIVDEISALQNVRIKKFLGKGYHGTTFLLCDDRVLKFYASGTGELEREKEFYSSSKEKAHLGKGSRSSLMVYDQGEIQLNLYGRLEDKISYSIISKVYPLENFISYSNNFDRILRKIRIDIFKALDPSEQEQNNNEFRYFLDGKGNKIKVNLEAAQRFIEEMSSLIATEKSDYASFSKRIAENLLADIESFIKENSIHEIMDLHSGNIGVDPTSPLDNPRFVIFDI